MVFLTNGGHFSTVSHPSESAESTHPSPPGFNIIGEVSLLSALQTRPTTPIEWSAVKVSDLDTSLVSCRKSILEGNNRFLDSSPYSVLYRVIAEHENGTTSPVFGNIPPVTDLNRCAENALARYLENLYLENLHLESPVSKVTQITLVGFTPPNPEKKGSYQFPNHPNPCALCRDRLLTLLELGIVGEDTRILNVALNQDGSIPAAGRMTTAGSLILGSVDKSEKGLKKGVESTSDSLENEALSKLAYLFPDERLDNTCYVDLIHSSLNRLVATGEESCIVFGGSGGALKAIIAEPQTISLPEGESKNINSAAVAITAALNEEFSRALILYFSPSASVSSVTAQRFLDYLQHLEGESRGFGPECLKIIRVTPDGTGPISQNFDPRRELPLGEGVRDRKRNLQVGDDGSVKFSSKLGLSAAEVHQVVSSAWVICLSRGIKRDSGGEGEKKSSLSGFGIRNKTLELPTISTGKDIDLAFSENIKSQLKQKIQQWIRTQQEICSGRSQSEPRITAVVASRADGSPVENLQAVTAFSVTFESHSPEPLVHLLAELLLAPTEHARKVEYIHLGSTATFELNDHHQRLLNQIQSIHDVRPTIVRHELDDVTS